MDTDSFVIYIKTEDINGHTAKDIETRCNTSNFKLHRPLPKREKKVNGLMKDELGRKIIKS